MELVSPLLMQILLTFILLFATGYYRSQDIKHKRVSMPEIALGQHNWPVKTTQIANSYHNQLQTPILFYALILLLLLTEQSDIWQLTLAWAFVSMRYIHAFIHVTSNKVRYRFYSFLISIILLVTMWVRFALTFYS